MKQFIINSLQELPEVANALITHYPEAKVFCFEGKMGAGKTTLITAICNELNVTDMVSSPTFAIINEYLTQTEESIYHFDFYRIEHFSEAINIGIEEYFYSGNYCFLEWSERIANLLPENFVTVQIDEGDHMQQRIITFK